MIYALIAGDILMALTFFFRMNHLPSELPLFYSRSWGEDQLADIWYIFLIRLLMHISIFANNYIYSRIFFPDVFVKKIINIINWSLIIVYTFIFCRVLFFVS